MSSALDRTVRDLGEGSLVPLDSGQALFKLDSYEANPVVTPQQLGLTWDVDGEPRIGAVFNGGAELFEDKVILLPRCHREYWESTFFDKSLGTERRCLENYLSEVWPLVSEDGIHFARLGDTVIRGDGTDHKDFTHGIEDIRIVTHGGRHLLVGCGKVKAPFKGSDADRIAVYSTSDFSEITYQGIVESFDSRNAVPFPQPVGGKQYILLRFHPNIHLDVLDEGIEQLLNPARYRDEWQAVYERRNETLLFAAGDYPHEREKIGPGPQVLKTDKGWLLIYHAVGVLGERIAKTYGLRERVDRGYSVCAALLDLDDPQTVRARTANPIYIPSAPYETCGNKEYPVDVPSVVFPVGAFRRGDRLMVYAGAADKYMVLLSCHFQKLLNYLLEHCRPNF